MAKKPDSNALGRFLASQAPAARPVAEPAPRPSAARAEPHDGGDAPAPTGNAARRLGNGRQQFQGHAQPEAIYQLKQMALEDSTTQGRRVSAADLLVEALNDYFIKRGKPPCA